MLQSRPGLVVAVLGRAGSVLFLGVCGACGLLHEGLGGGQHVCQGDAYFGNTCTA